MTEKRHQNRSICADLVHLEWIGHSGVCECTAVLEDISPRGACLQVESPVPVEIEAVISHGKHWSAECRIKYCSFREIGYYLGVEFVDADSWRKHEFRPDHLMDLRDFVEVD
jgi:hypothetical protein